MKKGIDKEKIMAAAVELADKQGLEAVTLGEIAKVLGVKTPSLYNHIKGLDDLRKRLALLGLKELRTVMMQAAVGKSQDDAVLSIADAFIAFAMAHPGLYQSTVTAPDEGDKELIAAADDIIQLMVTVFHGYQLEETGVIHAVRGLRSLLHGFASLTLQQGFKMDIDKKESLRVFIQTYLQGLKNR